MKPRTWWTQWGAPMAALLVVVLYVALWSYVVAKVVER